MIPKDAKRKERPVLAEGEATGHMHVAERADVLECPDGSIYCKAPKGGARVVHPEHGIIDLPAGDYRVGRVREMDHAAEDAREVRD